MMKKRSVMTALVGGLLMTGVVGASAASLGGLTGSGLGSDDQIVAACDGDGITTTYTTAYNATAQTYQVTGVNFGAVNAACNGKAASLTLRNGASALGTTTVASITVAVSAFSITLVAPVAASAVNGLSLVISG